MERKCKYCGKVLETSDGRVWYCSDECRMKAYKEESKAYNKRNRLENPEYRRKTYDSNLRRYHAKRLARFEELAVELKKLDGKELVEFLQENFRLRH